MSDLHKTVTREELFEQVLSKPMTILAHGLYPGNGETQGIS